MRLNLNDSLEQMYQEVILEESRDPSGRVYAIEDPHKSHQFNPSCGDDITVAVELDDASLGENASITTIKWAGEGCSISIASASILTGLLTGSTVTHADSLIELFTKLMNSRGDGLSEEELDTLGDASVFTGTSKFPARIKCALLAWTALRGAMNNSLSGDIGTASGFSKHADKH